MRGGKRWKGEGGKKRVRNGLESPPAPDPWILTRACDGTLLVMTGRVHASSPIVWRVRSTPAREYSTGNTMTPTWPPWKLAACRTWVKCVSRAWNAPVSCCVPSSFLLYSQRSTTVIHASRLEGRLNGLAAPVENEINSNRAIYLGLSGSI